MQQSVAMMTATAALGMTLATQAFGFWVGMAGAWSESMRRPLDDAATDPAEKPRESAKNESKPSTGAASDAPPTTAAMPSQEPNVVPLRRAGTRSGLSRQATPRRSTGTTKVESNPILDAVAEAQEAVSPPRRDDLKAISGIGPKLEQVLNGEGISTYVQLASLSARDVASLERKFGMEGRIDRDDWVAEAKTLAGGARAGRSAAKTGH